jgi:nicotinamidase-related amidase
VTTLPDRPNSALLVVDVQNGAVANAHERDAVVSAIAGLVEKARELDVLVVWVQHSDDGLSRGTDDWRIVPELVPGAGEPLVVTGAETDACIRSTLHGAFVRGYDTLLVKDAHTTSDQTPWGAPPPDQVIAHTNLYWTYQSAPGRTAGTVQSSDVDFLPAT